MCQVRCGSDQSDHSIEYQINWFVDCTETLIHSHRHSFTSYCLEGAYVEKLWEIADEKDNGMIHEFRRNADGTLHLHNTIPGTLRHIGSRQHFPGNELHVDTSQCHSISPVVGSRDRVLTFLIKRNHIPASEMRVLSLSSDIETRNDDIRSATSDERRTMYEKLTQVLTMNLC